MQSDRWDTYAKTMMLTFFLHIYQLGMLKVSSWLFHYLSPGIPEEHIVLSNGILIR
jgi:hypothetical protein